VLAAFAPIWALTAVGYLTGRSRVLGPAAVDLLGRYVFYVAMPAALLSTLTRHPIAGFAGKGLAAFAVGTFVIGGTQVAVSSFIDQTSGYTAVLILSIYFLWSRPNGLVSRR